MRLRRSGGSFPLHSRSSACVAACSVIPDLLTRAGFYSSATRATKFLAVPVAPICNPLVRRDGDRPSYLVLSLTLRLRIVHGCSVLCHHGYLVDRADVVRL